jgi:hypothetical protein
MVVILSKAKDPCICFCRSSCFQVTQGFSLGPPRNSHKSGFSPWGMLHTMSDSQQPAKKWPLVLLGLNAIGAGAYVLLASRAWVIRQECEAGINSITGEPLVWFISIAPVIVVFFLLNVAWGTIILKRHQWKTGHMWLVAAAIWIVAAIIDFSHHQC